MNLAVQKRFLVCLIVAAVAGAGIFVIVCLLARARQGEVLFSSVPDGNFIQDVRNQYLRWRTDRNVRRAEALIRDSDLWLEGNGSEYFRRYKPVGPDGTFVQAKGTNSITQLIPPTGGRNSAVLEIPAEWSIIPGTTNTGMEAYVLKVADTLKAHGFRKVTVVATWHGQDFLLFDGGLPPRQNVAGQK